MFILNTPKVIEDLLVRRAGIYSDRPKSTMLNDLIGTEWIIPFMDYNDEWKEHRRIFRREFDSIDASTTNKRHEVNAARRLLRRLLTSTDHQSDLRLAAADAILSITYGITPTDVSHPLIKTPEGINAIFADVAKGGYLVDVFPFLKHIPKWVPGIQFHKVAAKGRPLAKALVMAPYEEVKRQVKDGVAVPSVASKLLYAVQESDTSNLKEVETVRNVLGNAYLGGADTTVCALFNFTLAMALYPKVQKKARGFIDNVLEGNRLPEFSDVTELPYLTAVVYEILRWHPVTPFAIYHLCTKEDFYEEYSIPKGSIMIPNLWAILQDETIFGADTNHFRPERFLKKDGSVKDLPEMVLAFGFGRRKCPGHLMAFDTLWIMAAHLLAAYEIVNPIDEQGRPITTETHLEYTNAMVSFPPSYKVSLRRRLPENMILEALSS